MTDAVATKNLVDAAVSAAMARVLPAELAGSDPLVRRSEHADYQSNIALALAKQAGRPSRSFATDLHMALASRHTRALSIFEVSLRVCR